MMIHTKKKKKKERKKKRKRKIGGDSEISIGESFGETFSLSSPKLDADG